MTTHPAPLTEPKASRPANPNERLVQELKAKHPDRANRLVAALTARIEAKEAERRRAA